MTYEPDHDSALRLGVVGLGRAFTLMLPTLSQDPRVRLVAAVDPRPTARARFEQDFDAPGCASVAQLCALPQVEAVYIASPHECHAEHVREIAAAGKHILVEKPLAISLAECTKIIDAVEQYGINLIVGPSHSFDEPVQHARRLLSEPRFGCVRMIHAFNYTSFLYRPRRPEELNTEKGGGVVFSQGAHQVDIARLLVGGQIATVRGLTGAWDAARPTEGAYSALLQFADGAMASLTYSGYAHYDSDELFGDIGEFGQNKSTADYGRARADLRTIKDAAAEARMKTEKNYGGSAYQPISGPSAQHHPHFGHLLISTETADLRVTPDGVWVYADDRRYFCDTPIRPILRAAVIDELWDAVRLGKPPVHSARWGRATTEACLGILESARTGADVIMHFQRSI